MKLREVPMCWKARKILMNCEAPYMDTETHLLTKEDLVNIADEMYESGLKFSFDLVTGFYYSRFITECLFLEHAIDGVITLDFDKKAIYWIDNDNTVVKHSTMSVM
jgi:hypothetical protein